MYSFASTSTTNGQPLTGSLAQAGVLSRGTPRRILEVLLPSEPYRYPRLPQAAKTLTASGGKRSAIGKRKRQSVADKYGETRKNE